MSNPKTIAGSIRNKFCDKFNYTAKCNYGEKLVLSNDSKHVSATMCVREEFDPTVTLCVGDERAEFTIAEIRWMYSAMYAFSLASGVDIDLSVEEDL